MQLSARNIFKGTVKSIMMGAVNAEIIVELAKGLEITSVVTKKSCEDLGLEIGKETYVIIKASNVLLGTE